jgi:hypothetical protein
MKVLTLHIAALLMLGAPDVGHAAELTDPTRPVAFHVPPTGGVRASSGPGKLKLEAILLANQRRLVIVNGKVLRVGECLGDVCIESISSDHVQYLRGGRSNTLWLTEQVIQVRRAAASHEAKQ